MRHAIERILVQLVELATSINGHVAATTLGRSPTDYRDSFRLAVEAGLVDQGTLASFRRGAYVRSASQGT